MTKPDTSQDHQWRPALLSTAGDGPAGREAFIEQFAAVHRGQPVQLLAYLHPGLHHEHLADTVRDVVAVTGVEVVRWINRHRIAPGLLSDALRAVLAGYHVRVIPDGLASVLSGELAAADWTARGAPAMAPAVVLYSPVTHTALVTAELDGTGPADQRTLDLADLVDQALRDACDDGSLPSEVELGLRCSGCRRITGAGEDLEALQLCAGAVCGQPGLRTADPCPGVLEAVTVVCAPADLALYAQPPAALPTERPAARHTDPGE